jgi:hypothetical protein
MQLPHDSLAYNAYIDNKESSNIWCTNNLKGILHKLGFKHIHGKIKEYCQQARYVYRVKK